MDRKCMLVTVLSLVAFWLGPVDAAVIAQGFTPRITFPVAGEPLKGQSLTFTWTAPESGGSFLLAVGTREGGSELFAERVDCASSVGSVQVPLPPNVGTAPKAISVRLSWEHDRGWSYIDQAYTLSPVDHAIFRRGPFVTYRLPNVDTRVTLDESQQRGVLVGTAMSSLGDVAEVGTFSILKPGHFDPSQLFTIADKSPLSFEVPTGGDVRPVTVLDDAPGGSFLVMKAPRIEGLGNFYRAKTYRPFRFSGDLKPVTTTKVTERDGTEVPVDPTRKLMVFIHGWNPGAVEHPFADRDKPVAQRLWSPLFDVTRERLFIDAPVPGQPNLVRHPEWEAYSYEWAHDAATGPTAGGYSDITLADFRARPSFWNGANVATRAFNSGTKAAEAAHLHGKALGERLRAQFPNLRKVHLIAHSAGTWAARSAAVYLYQTTGVEIQITLLDPFVPQHPLMMPVHPLSLGALNALATDLGRPGPFGAELSRLEAYSNRDVALGTNYSILFDWRAGKDDAQEVAGPGEFDLLPAGHFIPVHWYARSFVSPGDTSYRNHAWDTSLARREHHRDAPAEIAWPRPGTVLTGSAVPIQIEGPAGSTYQIMVGTSPCGFDLVPATAGAVGPEGLSRIQLKNLPTDGSRLHVTVLSRSLLAKTYTFIAAPGGASDAPPPGIAPATVEVVTAPRFAPAGDARGSVGLPLMLSSALATSNLGHPPEYAVDYGDGTPLAWSAAPSATHAWTTPGQKVVFSRARCAQHHAAVSQASPVHLVEIVAPASAPSGTSSPPPARLLISTSATCSAVDVAWSGGLAGSTYAVYKNGGRVTTTSLTSHRDTSVRPGENVWYLIQAAAPDGAVRESPAATLAVPSCGETVAPGSLIPIVTRFDLNNGAEVTKNRFVVLNNVVQGEAVEYKAAEQFNALDNLPWLPYSASPTFALAGGGNRTVFFKVRNAAGLESGAQSDQINHQLPPPPATGFAAPQVRTVRFDCSDEPGVTVEWELVPQSEATVVWRNNERYALVMAPQTSYRDLNVHNGQVYSYSVRAQSLAFPPVFGEFSEARTVEITDCPALFSSTRRRVTGEGPYSVAACDADGFGRVTLVSANYGRFHNSEQDYKGTLSVALGNGAGGFEPSLHLPLAQRSTTVFAADLDNDHREDLVVDEADESSVFRSLGGGAFARGFKLPGMVQALADFDGDGAPDALLTKAEHENSRNTIWLGNRDATFRKGTWEGPAGGPLGHVAVGDFNRDGQLDFAGTDGKSPHRIEVRLGVGDGAFGEPRWFESGTGHGGQWLSAGDVDRDGFLDLVVYHGRVDVLNGVGDGSFRAPVALPLAEMPRLPTGDFFGAVADLDGDGYADVVVNDPQGDRILIRLMGPGNGPREIPVSVEDFPTGITITDVDRDQIPDIVVANHSSDSFTVLRGATDLRLPRPPAVRSVVLEEGADRSDDAEVTVDVTASAEVSELSWSESPDFAGAAWLPFSSRFTATLSAGPGLKAIFVKVRGASGMESPPAMAGIRIGNESETESPIPFHDLTITSNSADSGLTVTASVADDSQRSGGTTPLTLSYPVGLQLSLTAPGFVGTRPFLRWERDGVAFGNGATAVAVSMDAPHALRAVYGAPPPAPAELTGPPPGSTLTGRSVTFAWNAGSGVGEYFLYVGTTPGGTQIFSGSAGLALQKTITGLPTNGDALYVRLYSRLAKGWEQRDYQYRAVTATKAVLTAPAPGSLLTGTSAVLTWSAGAAADAYWLDMGTTSGGTNIRKGDVGLATSTVVTGLPTHGGSVFVRLWTRFASSWVFNDFRFTALDGRATVSSPAPGATLAASTATFTWTAGTGVSEYFLYVGSKPGESDISSGSTGLNREKRVSGLPVDGRTVFVRVYSKFPTGWALRDYQYTAVTVTKAALTSPAPGSSLTSTSSQFTWTAGLAADEYWLDVGTAKGGTNLATGTVGTALQKTVSGLPVKGGPLFVTLWTRFGSRWVSVEYGLMSADGRAALTTPAPETALAATSVTFAWSDGVGVLEYYLEVGTTAGGTQIAKGSTGQARQKTVTGLPSNGAPVHVTLWSRFASGWSSRAYRFTAPLNR